MNRKELTKSTGQREALPTDGNKPSEQHLDWGSADIRHYYSLNMQPLSNVCAGNNRGSLCSRDSCKTVILAPLFVIK